MDNLKNFSYSMFDYDMGVEFNYSQGIFTVGVPGLPPLLVFNSFPNPGDFTNMLGFYYKFMQGIMENPP